MAGTLGRAGIMAARIPVVATDYPRASYAWYVVCILVLMNILSAVDRQLPALLVKPIRHDLAITDTEISLLQGLAFALFYACCGVPLGWLTDRTNRRNIILVGVVLWSLMTAACGLATDFRSLFIARIGVGLGEASLLPAAYSLIADYFAVQKRGRALSLFTTAQFTGVGISWGIGGVLILAAANSQISLPVFGPLVPWQLAFVAVGLAGVVLSPLVMTIAEPERQDLARRETREASNGPRLLKYLKQHRAVFVPVYLVYAMMGFVGYNFQVWLPTYFERRYALPAPVAGLRIGIVISVLGTVGCLVSGYLGDRWTSEDRVGGRLRVTLLWWILALVSTIGMFLSPTASICMIFVGVFNLGAAISLASAAATIQDIVPNELRGRATALYLLLLGVIGFGFGPSAVALVTDYVFHDDSALKYSLLIVPVPGILLGATCVLAGLRPYDRLARSMKYLRRC
jgi:MFS family permease